ncbi:hypothetical protein WDW86_15780 [Bdellovibrionota bacterium FG-2]
MAIRESREDKLVRQMIPQLTESLIELKAMPVGTTKESDVEAWCRRVVKSVLGFSASAGYDVRTQETRGKMRFDLVVTRLDKPEEILLVAEIKRLGANLSKSDLRSGKGQLQEYLKHLGNVRWGILTNGFEWCLYDYKSDSINVISTDVRDEEEQIDSTAKGALDAALNLIEFSAHYFETKVWENLSAEAQALSPEALARSIVSIDIMKKVAKYLNEEFDYRVSLESLTEKLSLLVENGLKGLVGSWNEVKRAEFEKYVRSQQRQLKKNKPQRVVAGAAETEAPATNGEVQASTGTSEPAIAPSVASDEKKAA